MLNAKRIVLLLVIAFTGMASWACQRPTVEATGPTTAQEEVEQSVTADSTTLVVAERETAQVIITSTPTPIPEGGFVTRATFGDAQTANPILAADAPTRALCDLMFEGLLRRDPFTGEWVPHFAEGWTVSEDGLAYTFTIRRDLVWSDGEPITAHDFAFSYRALLSGALDTPNAGLVDNIDDIKVLDDDTVRVTFAHARSDNLYALQLGWLPMHVFTTDAAQYDWRELDAHEFNGRPTVVSGPFVLQEWTRGERWTVVRNEHYWRGAPYLEGITNRVVSGQEEMIEFLMAGTIDVSVGFDPQYLAQVEKAPDLRIYKFLSDEYDFIAFNLGDPDDPQPRLLQDGSPNEGHGTHPILGDVLVRQAIVHAIDRQALIDQARAGEGVLLHANVLPMVSWAYNTDLEERAFDPEQAGQMLDRAGWTLDSDRRVRIKEGRRLRLRLYINKGNRVREIMARQIETQLAQVGIDVVVIAVDWPSLVDILAAQTFDLVLTSWHNLGIDPYDERLWAARNDQRGTESNLVSLYDPTLEALYAEAREASAFKPTAQAEIYRRIQARLYDLQPYCWIDVPRELVAFHERIGGVNPGPWDMWYNVHAWYITAPAPVE